jgi:hypothetical protein
MRYREHFHLNWQEFLDTPWEVVVKDLELLDLEATIKNAKSKKQ